MRKPEQLASGRFKVRFRLNGKETSETFARRRTIHGQMGADQFASLLEAVGSQAAVDQLYAGSKDRGTPTLDKVAADHIAHLTGIEEGTRLNYTRLWARTWGPLIGHLAADTVTDDHVKKAVNELATRYSEKSLKNQRGLLAPVCERAVEKHGLRTNPTKGVRLPRGAAPSEDGDDHEMVCLNLDEWPPLYDSLHDHYKPFVRYLAGVGPRFGEAIVNQVKDVDRRAGTIRIRRALKWSPDGKRTIGPPKTKKSRRTLQLPSEVLADLEPLLKGKTGDDLIFTMQSGQMIDHRHFWSGHWRPALWRAQHCLEHRDPACRCGTAHPERCKVHEKRAVGCGCDGTLLQSPRIHDLRHTHASWLLGAGVPIHVVSARLGHEDIRTTVNTYGHLLPDAQIAAAHAASQAFARATPPKELE